MAVGCKGSVLVGKMFGLAAGGGGLNPSEITSATNTMWMDASDNDTLTLSGSDVTAWSDKSSTINDFVVPAARVSPRVGVNTQNGLQCIDYDIARADDLESSSTWSVIGSNTLITLYAAFNAKTFEAGPTYRAAGAIIDDGGFGGLHFDTTHGINAYGFRSGEKVAPAGASNFENEFVIARYRLSSDEIAIRIDNDAEIVSTLTSGIAANINSKELKIGTGVSASSTEANFYIGEVVAFDDVLSEEDDAALMTYLNSKWSVY